MNNYCIIMAGGIGSRFWPLSKDNYPKQFLDILGTGKSFIRSTYERFSPVIPDENFLVVTNKAYKQLVLEHLPMLRPDQVLCEPARRNTAPCIAYAAYHIQSRCAEANIVVTPADHLVTNEVEFQRIIRLGFDFLANNPNALMTIGIKPSRPETGYGYIQVPKENAECGMRNAECGMWMVLSFTLLQPIHQRVELAERGNGVHTAADGGSTVHTVCVPRQVLAHLPHGGFFAPHAGKLNAVEPGDLHIFKKGK